MAIVLVDHSVFLHVPKTGGKWVAQVLDRCGLVRRRITRPNKHIDARAVLALLRQRRRLPDLCRRLVGRPPAPRPFVFCFVRHPVSWYESWFKYMSQPERNWRPWSRDPYGRVWHPCAALDGLGSHDFNTFVRNVIRHRPGYVTEMYRLYDQPGVDFIGKQETLCDDLIAVLRRLGLDFDEKAIRGYRPVGVSPTPPRPVQWDPELLAEIERLEYASLVRYGYRSWLDQAQHAA